MPTIHTIRVSIRGSRPPIWRRLRVPSDTRLDRLHRVLQVAFGWTDSHLHSFDDGRTQYGIPDPMSDLGDTVSEKKATLGEVCRRPKSKLRYTYDFGDSWEHEIVVEKIEPGATSKQAVECVAGRRNGPPEDCGGVWGYANLIEVLSNPEHADQADLAEWIGGSYDAERFDLDEADKRLRKVR